MDAATAGLIGTGIGALTGLAGGWLNGRRQSKIEHVVQQHYVFDVRLGKAAALYRNSISEGIKALAACHHDCLQFDRVLLDEVTKINTSEMVTLKRGRAK